MHNAELPQVFSRKCRYKGEKTNEGATAVIQAKENGAQTRLLSVEGLKIIKTQDVFLHSKSQ